MSNNNHIKNSEITLRTELNLDFTIEQKINCEKRKRNQIYQTMDYFLSNLTFFDFFSENAFRAINKAKHLANFSNKKIVTSELLLASFFNCGSNLEVLLNEYGLSSDYLDENFFNKDVQYDDKLIHTNIELLDIFFEEFSNIFNPFDEFDAKKIKFSHEIILLFEKAAENALTRFKTPVISSEILFITLMEQKDSNGSKIIKKCMNDSITWQLLRYRLMKSLHSHESNVKGEVIKNQQYFAYLLKMRLTESMFDQLVTSERLPQGVMIFRNSLIKSILKLDLFKTLDFEIHKSIQITKSRKYSS